MKIKNNSANNAYLLSGGINTPSQHLLAHNMDVKTLSLSENRNTSLALSSPMLPQEYHETEGKDFSDVSPISKIIYMLISHDPNSVNGSFDMYSDYCDMNKYHQPKNVDGRKLASKNCLVLSVENDDLDMVKFLISNGAKLRSIPSKNNNPLDLNDPDVELSTHHKRKDEILVAIANEKKESKERNR